MATITLLTTMGRIMCNRHHHATKATLTLTVISKWILESISAILTSTLKVISINGNNHHPITTINNCKNCTTKLFANTNSYPQNYNSTNKSSIKISINSHAIYSFKLIIHKSTTSVTLYRRSWQSLKGYRLLLRIRVNCWGTS